MKYIHNTSGREFELLYFHKPQFSSIEFVALKNILTGNVEQFNKNTYLNYFTEI